MSFEYLGILIIVVLLVGYLGYALIRPEKM
ncbi:MAG: K(+)-transporting ATPase subunit F [Candidatus Margulisiibacteriota bacterium]